jgi:GNAT superfamily N-acetyltransferase
MDPRVECCQWDEIPPNEEDVFGWRTDLFGVASYGLQWATPEWRFLVHLADKPVVHIAVLRRTVTVGGRPVTVGGMTRLITVPQQRSRGLGTLALDHAARFTRDELSLPFAMGFCVERLIPFYRQRGWHEVDSRVLMDQPTGKLLSPCACVVLPLRVEKWPQGEVDVGGLPW